MTPYERTGEDVMITIAALMGGGLIAWLARQLVEDNGLS